MLSKFNVLRREEAVESIQASANLFDKDFTMADEPQKTLEMRVTELEDKLSKIHITEEEMKAYQKVGSVPIVWTQC